MKAVFGAFKTLKKDEDGNEDKAELVQEICAALTSREPVGPMRVEMARVYREMESGTRDSQNGSRLVYVLTQIAKVLELNEIERRLIILEARTQRPPKPSAIRKLLLPRIAVSERLRHERCCRKAHRNACDLQ